MSSRLGGAIPSAAVPIGWTYHFPFLVINFRCACIITAASVKTIVYLLLRVQPPVVSAGRSFHRFFAPGATGLFFLTDRGILELLLMKRGYAMKPLSPLGGVRRASLDGLFYLLGSILYALSVNVFTAPNQIAPGGVTGIATLVNYLTGLPIGTGILVVNLPLFVASWRFLGRDSTLRTAVVTVVSSVIIDVTAPFVPPFQGDKILTAVFGGVLAGAGLGLIFMRGATTGGSEIVARLLERRFRHIPIGRLILMVDAVVVATGRRGVPQPGKRPVRHDLDLCFLHGDEPSDLRRGFGENAADYDTEGKGGSERCFGDSGAGRHHPPRGRGLHR